MKTQAIFFDMDGLLIDSEPLWRKAQIEIFGNLGLTLKDADCATTTGLRIDEVCHHWYQKRPWKGISPDQASDLIVDFMIDAVLREGIAMPGAVSAVQAASKTGLPLGLVTSSPIRLVEPTLKKLALSDAFDQIASAFDLPYGKPNPAVYLQMTERLNVNPCCSMTFEDSLNGVIAAKAGRLFCVAVPSPENFEDPRMKLADRLISTLEEVDQGWIRGLLEGED